MPAARIAASIELCAKVVRAVASARCSFRSSSAVDAVTQATSASRISFLWSYVRVLPGLYAGDAKHGSPVNLPMDMMLEIVPSAISVFWLPKRRWSSFWIVRYDVPATPRLYA